MNITCISFQSKLITSIANVNVDTEKITNPSEGIADRVLDSRSVFIFKLDWDRLNIAREKLNKGKYLVGNSLEKTQMQPTGKELIQGTMRNFTCIFKNCATWCCNGTTKFLYLSIRMHFLD